MRNVNLFHRIGWAARPRDYNGIFFIGRKISSRNVSAAATAGRGLDTFQRKRMEEKGEESARQIGRHVLMRLAMINNLPVTTLPSHDQFDVDCSA